MKYVSNDTSDVSLVSPRQTLREGALHPSVLSLSVLSFSITRQAIGAVSVCPLVHDQCMSFIVHAPAVLQCIILSKVSGVLVPRWLSLGVLTVLRAAPPFQRTARVRPLLRARASRPSCHLANATALSREGPFTGASPLSACLKSGVEPEPLRVGRVTEST